MNTTLTPTRRPWLATLFSLMTAGASAAPAASNLPLVELPPAATAGAPLATLVWVGIGRASVWVDGAWRAAPAHDYEFSVTQRRHADRWESIKVQHRRHPDYDGSAGARDQAHYFRVDYPPAAGEAPPTWPGHPVTAHWRCQDPEQFETAAERRLALIRARTELERRLRVFVNLPLGSLDRTSLQAQCDALG